MAQAVTDLALGRPTSFALTDQASSNGESEMGFIMDAEHFAKALDIISVTGNSPAEKRAEIFKLVDVYYDYAADKVHNLREVQRQTTSTGLRRSDDASSQDSMDLDDTDNGASSHIPSETLQYWEQEAQVWDMLRRLLPLRYSNRSAAKPIRREISKFESCSDLWDEFLEADPTAQERKAILECLQTSADETGADIDELVREYQQRAERGDIIAYGWLHTRSAIKMQKNVNGWSGALDPNSSDAGRILVDTNGSNPLVTQLDPDVATRQNRKLQPQDEYFERAIWLGCYELLRRGRSIAEIKDWCVERTEVWRAVSMSAMPLSRDERSERFACDPLSTLLWRRTCFALARQGGTDDYERAVYGILSGDIPSVEKVCQGWDDFVFAHYNALLRTQFDAYLMKRSSPDSTTSITQMLPAFNAVQFHGDAASVGERLVSSLETNPKTSAEAKTPMKALQAAIISNNLSQYITDLGSALGGRANDAGITSALIPAFGDSTNAVNDTKFFQLNDHKGLRVLVHVYLLMSSLDNLQGDGYVDLEQRKAQENVISAYVSTLRLNGMIDLMPLYCSRLQGDRAFFTLSRNLRGVVDTSDRDMLLRIMEKLGMDIAKFVVFQPYSILQQAAETEHPPAFGALSIFTNDPPTLKYGRPLKPDFFGDEPEIPDATDEQLIQSMEWFMLVDGLWDELFQVGTIIYKRFLKQLNLHAARQLSERVRCADIFKKKTGLSIDEDGGVGWFDELRAGVANGSFEVSTLTPEDIVKARNYFEMECLVRALDCMETIASSEAMAQDPTEQLTREFWSHVGETVKSLRSFMRPILSNWLLESMEEDEDFGYLRDLYLPETIIGYVSVLHFAGTSLSRDNLLECMELSSIIAKKDADVATVLMKSGRMKEIVEGFANCSKALAISGNDKKSSGGSSKKLREMGWSRDLWAVKRRE
ncbi:nuclear pore protein 84/107 [Biscogniauxia mediterranea]|nr:nuclear pore protein 84/107 [Biscogniauxia mediterranea]